MKYKTAQNMAAGLRNLADFIEEHGVELPSEYGWSDPDVRLTIYATSNAEKAKLAMRRAARAMAKQGIVRKEYGETGVVLRQSFGPHVHLNVRSSREAVCTKRVVEIQRVPKQAYVEIPGEFIDKEVVEWDCDPVIANA